MKKRKNARKMIQISSHFFKFSADKKAVLELGVKTAKLFRCIRKK